MPRILTMDAFQTASTSISLSLHCQRRTGKDEKQMKLQQSNQDQKDSDESGKEGKRERRGGRRRDGQWENEGREASVMTTVINNRAERQRQAERSIEREQDERDEALKLSQEEPIMHALVPHWTGKPIVCVLTPSSFVNLSRPQLSLCVFVFSHTSCT